MADQAENEYVEPDYKAALGKTPTTLQTRFADWLQGDEVGYNPTTAKSKKEAFEEGVRLGVALRIPYQASDHNRAATAEEKEERAALREQAKAERAEAKAAREEAAAAKAASKTEPEEAPKPVKAAPKGKAKAAPAATPAAAPAARRPAARRAPARAAAVSTADAPF